MTDPKRPKTIRDEAWLRRVAEEEDKCPSISVGGLVTRLGMYPIAEVGVSPSADQKAKAKVEIELILDKARQNIAAQEVSDEELEFSIDEAIESVVREREKPS